MITPATFRQDYTEFANQAKYPNSMIQYWINVGVMLLRVERWGPGAATASAPVTTPYDFALELWVAHNIVIEKQAVDAAQRGGTPGVAKGPISSDHVGSVSRSYATSEAMEPDAGHWNLTVYGLRYKRLSDYFGAGPIQVGIGCDPYGGLNGPGWPGPWPWVGQTMFG